MNIYDIAKLAGVSTATVSRVVNGSTSVSEKTRQKVLGVIKSTSYTPNVFARGLGTNSMRTVGILCADIAHPFMARAVSLLQQPLHDKGYDCILSCTGLAHDDKLEHTRRLLGKHIDALILVGSKYEDPSSNDVEPDYVALAAQHIPVFLLNGRIPGDNVYCTYSNDLDVTRDLTTALLKRGRRRILFLSDSPAYVVLRRLCGYEDALTAAGIPVDPALELSTRNDVHYAKQVLLQRAGEGLAFDAVVASEDSLAIGAIKYAHERGLAIPDDIEICGFNNTSLAVSCDPELTSVDNQLEAQCAETVENLLAVLAGESDVLRERVFPAQVVHRRTTRI